MTSTPPRPTADVVDRVAIGVSLACVAHCLALPLMIAVAPSLLPALWDDQVVHMVALGLALPLAAVGIGFGLRTTRDATVLLLALLGLSGMAAGIVLHHQPPLDVLFTLSGALAVAAAHLRNYLLRQRPTN